MSSFDIRPYSPRMPPPAAHQDARRKASGGRPKGKKTARPQKTKLQRMLPQIEGYLRGFIRHQGFAPVIRDVCIAFGLSTSQARRAIGLLVESGALVRAPRTARGIQFADQLKPHDPLEQFYDVFALTSEGSARLNTEPIPLDVAHGLINGSLERLTYHRRDCILYTTEGDWVPVTARRHDGTLIAEYTIVEAAPLHAPQVTR